MFSPKKGLLYYYDSFGLLPQNPHIMKFLQKFETFYNPLTFQSIGTNVCGLYVLYFIFMCSIGKPLEKIVWIVANQNYPDLYILKFVIRNVIV